MSNLGYFSFADQSKDNLKKIAGLINSEEEDFSKKALMYISAKTFNETLKDASSEILNEIKRLAATPEVMQSYYRTQISEQKIKESFINAHNFYIDKFVSECGGNYSDSTVEEIRALKL